MHKSRLTPSFLEMQLKEIETSCKILRSKIAEARQAHKALPKGNSTYDDVAYYTFQIAIHNDIIRAKLEKTENKHDTILANGTKLAW